MNVLVTSLYYCPARFHRSPSFRWLNRHTTPPSPDALAALPSSCDNDELSCGLPPDPFCIPAYNLQIWCSQFLQFFLLDSKLYYSSIILAGSPFLRTTFSPPAQVTQDPPVCENPLPFPTTAPTSKPLAMALAAETKSIVAQFDYSDEDVNKGVQEFLRQMGEYLAAAWHQA